MMSILRKSIKIGGGVLLLWCIGLICFNQTVISYKKEVPPQPLTLQNKISYNGFDGSEFVAFHKYDEKTKFEVRPIALYLPQYHQFKENNLWHGRGFTEWSNVTAAKPLFAGHYQPKLPIDVGFYDLSHEDVMYRQIELAKNYGIYGFAFYYYWFSGKKLMEKPLDNFLRTPELDMPFCLHWANESWSKRWDGGNNEVLIEQKFSEADFERFAEDLLPFFKDKRYIRVNGKPMFIIYRPALFGKELFVKFTTYLRSYMRSHGVGELYLLGTKQFYFFDNPQDYGLDGVLDFSIRPLYGLKTKNVAKIYPQSEFKVLDWENYILNNKMVIDYKYKTFRTLFPRWDNAARKAFTGAIVYEGTSPDIYGRWLSYVTKVTKRDFKGDERMFFINAWNEWAEGAMLEPDRKYGYAYLDMTRKVLEHKAEFKPNSLKPVGIAVLTGGSNRIAKAVSLLNEGVGDKLLISGVRPGVDFKLISSRGDIKPTNSKDVELGYTARDTVGNAKEVKAWTTKYNMDEIYVVTSFYHIPRSRLELKRLMPKIKMNFVAVDSDFVAEKWWKKWRSLKFLASEYTKFLIVYGQYLPYKIFNAIN